MTLIICVCYSIYGIGGDKELTDSIFLSENVKY